MQLASRQLFLAAAGAPALRFCHRTRALGKKRLFFSLKASSATSSRRERSAPRENDNSDEEFKLESACGGFLRAEPEGITRHNVSSFCALATGTWQFLATVPRNSPADLA